jgi:hypothetical protein
VDETAGSVVVVVLVVVVVEAVVVDVDVDVDVVGTREQYREVGSSCIVVGRSRTTRMPSPLLPPIISRRPARIVMKP